MFAAPPGLMYTVSSHSPASSHPVFRGEIAVRVRQQTRRLCIPESKTYVYSLKPRFRDQPQSVIKATTYIPRSVFYFHKAASKKQIPLTKIIGVPTNLILFLHSDHIFYTDIFYKDHIFLFGSYHLNKPYSFNRYIFRYLYIPIRPFLFRLCFFESDISCFCKNLIHTIN